MWKPEINNQTLPTGMSSMEGQQRKYNILGDTKVILTRINNIIIYIKYKSHHISYIIINNMIIYMKYKLYFVSYTIIRNIIYTKKQ